MLLEDSNNRYVMINSTIVRARLSLLPPDEPSHET